MSLTDGSNAFQPGVDMTVSRQKGACTPCLLDLSTGLKDPIGNKQHRKQMTSPTSKANNKLRSGSDAHIISWDTVVPDPSAASPS